MPRYRDPPRWPDPPRGQAPARTALAWQRTGLALAVIGALCLHAAAHDLPLLFALAALAFLTGAALTWWTGTRLYRERSAGAAAVAPRALRAIALGTLAAAAIAVVSVLAR
jgi:putative membrane protein